MKLALFTPLNPQKTGISDYIEELLPFLRKEFEFIDLFIEDYKPENNQIRTQFRCYHYLLFEQECARKHYDMVFYQIGNSVYHRYMVGFVQQYPGVILLHDYILHHLIAEMFKHLPNRIGYLEEAYYNHGRYCKELLETTMEHTSQEFQLFHYPMNRRILESSCGVIVHSQYLKQAVETGFPGCPVAVVPHHFWVDHDAGEAEILDLRDKQSLGSTDLIVACLGNIIPAKEPLKIAKVCHEIAARVGKLVLVFCGQLHESVDVNKILAYQSDKLRIIITGYLSKNEFEVWLQAVDIVVNLRYPTTGETSGSLIKTMGLGKPLIISDLEQYREFPDSACVRVDLSDGSGSELGASITKLAMDNEFRKGIGYNAREYIGKNHNIKDSARKIADFLQSEDIIKPVDPEGNLSFLRKLEQFTFLDHFTKELVLTVPDTFAEVLVEMMAETIAEFER